MEPDDPIRHDADVEQGPCRCLVLTSEGENERSPAEWRGFQVRRGSGELLGGYAAWTLIAFGPFGPGSES